MDYQQLRYFLAACDALNMTAAAAAENVSEQALSRSVRKLESELGCTLFVRGARRLTLTERGEELQAEARGYVANHEAILARFSAVEGDEMRRLAIAVSTGTFAQWLPQGFLARFVLARPDLAFEMRCFSEDSHGRPRASEGYDLVFSTCGVLDGGWEVLFSAQRPMRLLMSASHPLASRGHLTLRDLAGCSLGWSMEETPAQAEMAARLMGAGCKLEVRFGPSEIPFVEELVGAGRLVVPYGGPADGVGPGRALLEVEGLDVGWSLHVLARAGAPLMHEAAELLELVRAELRR